MERERMSEMNEIEKRLYNMKPNTKVEISTGLKNQVDTLTSFGNNSAMERFRKMLDSKEHIPSGAVLDNAVFYLHGTWYFLHGLNRRFEIYRLPSKISDAKEAWVYGNKLYADTHKKDWIGRHKILGEIIN